MAKIWLLGDTHFGHAKMLEYCDRPGGFENRILKGLKVIDEKSILIHLGDFCIGDDKKWHDIFFRALKAHKAILVKGNHDGKSNSWYYSNGWDFVCEHFTDTCFGKKILFSHVPLSRRKHDDYDLNIHGHFHNSDHRSHEPELVAIKNKRQKLFAVEYTNYQPVLLKTFLGL